MQNLQIRSVATRIADGLMIALSGWIANKWSIYDLSTVPQNPEIFKITSIAAGLLVYIVFPYLDVYRSWRGAPFIALLARAAIAWLAVYLIVMASLFLLFGGVAISRRWASSWLIYGVCALWIFRLLINIFLKAARRNGYNQKRVLLAGYGSLGQFIHRRTRSYAEVGYHIKYILSTESDVSPQVDGVEWIRNLAELERCVRAQSIDEVWLALPLAQQSVMKEILTSLRNDLVKIRWLPDLFALQIMSHKFEEFMGITAVHLNAAPAPGIHGGLKQLFDRIFAATALICLLPVLLVIAVAVKATSRGPIFFRQPRQGKDGRQFMIYKFRTMRMHHGNETVIQATRGDSRITKIGALLRKTSLDELPQFINVLLGDMSVVGPRPHAVEHNKVYSEKIEGYMLRHLVRPGITGWAQINGWRGETDTLEKMQRRVECDIYYINNWSFLLDVKIIWKTAFKGWSGQNAY